jgi:hypothetical protein
MGRQQVFAGRNQNAVTFRTRERTLGPVSNTVVLIVLASLLGMLYLVQVTRTNAYGYQINSLQKQQASLQAEHANLQVASARLESVQRVATSPEAQALTPTAPTATVTQ